MTRIGGSDEKRGEAMGIAGERKERARGALVNAPDLR